MLDVLDTQGAGPAALRSGALRSGAFVLGILLSLISAPLLAVISVLGRFPPEFGHLVQGLRPSGPAKVPSL